MKLKLLFCLFLLTALGSLESFSQVSVGYDNLEKPNIKRLAESTLVYVVRERETHRIDELQEIFSKAWTFSPIELIGPNQLSEYIDQRGYSFLTINCSKTVSAQDTSMTYLVKYGLNIWMPNYDKKTEDDPEAYYFANISLYPSTDTYMNSRNLTLDEMVGYAYSDDSEFYNWHPGFVKNYLRLINDCFKKEERWTFYAYHEKKEQLGGLKKNTLYVPDYALNSLAVYTTLKETRQSVSDVLSKYEYKYKVLPAKEISEMLLSGDDEIYYVTSFFLHSKTTITLSVTNNKTGDIIYRKHLGITNKLRSKHFNHISKKVK